MQRRQRVFTQLAARSRCLLTTAILLAVALGAATSKAADPPPKLEDIAYGPHERNKLDLWQAPSDSPTPLLIYIHGGGFVAGDKGNRSKSAVTQCINAGVSFASINYRFRTQAPLQDILRDAARAVQYLRSRAKELNIDPNRIAAYGSSAGAGTSLWLAFHDDLADPNAADPVLRESSRLIAAGSLEGQASYDLREWDTILGASKFGRPTEELYAAYGFLDVAAAETPEADKIMKDCSMLGLISRDDPPVVIACGLEGGNFKNLGHYLHHPKHSVALADRCKEHGVECKQMLYDGTGQLPNVPKRNTEVVEFLIEKLKAPAN
jgi:acetyl esterase/lipase